MITNDNKGTYLVKNGQKHDNVIYERPLSEIGIFSENGWKVLVGVKWCNRCGEQVRKKM